MRLRRRRAIQVIAACGLLGGSGGLPPVASAGVRWRGVALGAPASIVLHGMSRARAVPLLRQCAAEIRRLEEIFSLYQAGSALRRLNRAGILCDPPFELVDLLGQAQAVSALTGGAFDLTVQPLWEVHAAHFASPRAESAGPAPRAIEAARAQVDYSAVEIDREVVWFRRPGMAITANGIAQGYITDRVASLLRAEGIVHCLVDLGEIRALGGRGDGAPWRVGSGGGAAALDVTDRAVATSDPAGTRLSRDGRHHHLFDPRTGRPAVHARPVTVIAPTATRADAWSTACAVLSPAEVARLGHSLCDIDIVTHRSPSCG